MPRDLAVWILVLLPFLPLAVGSPPAQDEPPEFAIRLHSRTFVPAEGIDAAIVDALQDPAIPGLHVLIQFSRPLSVGDHQGLAAAGVRLLEYLHPYVYVSWVPRDPNARAVANRFGMRSASLLAPGDKVEPAIVTLRIPDWGRDPDTGRLRVVVVFHRDVREGAAEMILGAMGLVATRHGANPSWATTATRPQIDALAARDQVRMIVLGPTPRSPLNEGGRRATNTDAAQLLYYGSPFSASPQLRGASGIGVRIGICDDGGVDETHGDFSWLLPVTPPDSRFYHTSPAGGSHGTRVASVAGGTGQHATTYGWPLYSLRGHAPMARLGDYAAFGDTVEEYHAALVDDATDVTVHSYNEQLEPWYYTNAANLDAIVRGDAIFAGTPIPSRPQVWAYGNNGVEADIGNYEGYYSGLGAAKNTIHVGSVDVMDLQVSEFSSLGPTLDGRVKPDLVAAGHFDSLTPFGGIRMATSGGGYTESHGTSYAAPAVTGILALMADAYRVAYPQGNGLEPCTYKAILVQTARDLVKAQPDGVRDVVNPDTETPLLYHAGPDYASGHGLVDAAAAVATVRRPERWLEATMSMGAVDHYWCLEVPEGSGPVKVVLAWDDEPACPDSDPTLSKIVNDLDLVLIDPDGVSYRPWVLDPPPVSIEAASGKPNGGPDPITPADIRPAYRDRDDRNNVEVVSVCAPTPGTWRVRVSASYCALASAQPYGLAASHDLSEGFCGWSIDPTAFVCMRFPWLCEPFEMFPPRIPELDRRLELDPEDLIPLSALREALRGATVWRGPSWVEAPGFAIDIRGLPSDAVVIVFDDAGEIVLESTEGGVERILRIETIRPSARHYAGFATPAGEPYSDVLTLELSLRPLE